MNRVVPWQPAAFLVAWLAIGVVGCGRTEQGQVSGKVTFGGQPIPFGSIAFSGPDGGMASGMIQNGNYLVAEAPLGEAKVAIQSLPTPPNMRAANPQGAASAPADSPNPAHVVIPQRYSSPDESGLTCTVIAGEQTQNFELKP